MCRTLAGISGQKGNNYSNVATSAERGAGLLAAIDKVGFSTGVKVYDPHDARVPFLEGPVHESLRHLQQERIGRQSEPIL